MSDSAGTPAVAQGNDSGNAFLKLVDTITDQLKSFGTRLEKIETQSKAPAEPVTPTVPTQQPTSSNEPSPALAAYQQLGTADELAAKLAALATYEAIGTADDVAAQLASYATLQADSHLRDVAGKTNTNFDVLKPIVNDKAIQLEIKDDGVFVGDVAFDEYVNEHLSAFKPALYAEPQRVPFVKQDAGQSDDGADVDPVDAFIAKANKGNSK